LERLSSDLDTTTRQVVKRDLKKSHRCRSAQIEMQLALCQFYRGWGWRLVFERPPHSRLASMSNSLRRSTRVLRPRRIFDPPGADFLTIREKRDRAEVTARCGPFRRPNRTHGGARRGARSCGRDRPEALTASPIAGKSPQREIDASRRTRRRGFGCTRAR
jgi:hypothetical protein